LSNPIIHKGGTKRWLDEAGHHHHRLDGPAIEYSDGSKAWLINGRFHRIDGPAIDQSDGTKEWYYDGNKIDCSSQEEFEKLIKLKAFW
jgi:hypothetical protein